MCWTQERRQEREVVSPNFVTFAAAISDCVEQKSQADTKITPAASLGLPIPEHHPIGTQTSSLASQSQRQVSPVLSTHFPFSSITQSVPGILPFNSETGLRGSESSGPRSQPVLNHHRTFFTFSRLQQESCQAITHNQPRICPAVEAAPLKRVLA